MTMRLMTVVLLSLAFVSCTSTQLDEQNAPSQDTAPETPEKYNKLIERFARGDSEYTGFYNNFEYKAILLSSVVREASLKRQGDYYQWDREKQLVEREKVQKELAEETRVFMSFFTPDRNNDNLTNAKSIWKIYIDAGGRRYEGKVKRLRNLLAELQSLYPFHTRWTTPYEVSFPVATTAIETQEVVYTITGPLGTRAVTFPAVK